MRITQNPNSLMLKAGLAALIVSALPAVAAAASPQACVEGLWPTAKGAGITRATFDRAFQGFTPDPEVVEAANFQPEYVKPIGEYIDRAVSDKRVEIGKQKLAEYQALLGSLESRYGVDKHIIVAIWGVELNYGMQPGEKNVIRSLATLICTGTKAKFARPQLVSALKILQRGDISFEGMNGSWAGAMGHTQFIPTTYSAYAVDQDGKDRQAIARALADKARTIRIPVHVVEKLNKIGRAERKLVTELGREPTADEIAEVTGIDPEEVDSIKRSAQAPVTLEKPVGDEEESEFGQFIADERAESPYERAAEILTKEALREALENLSYRERRVLELRYGLGGEHPRTLDEVGRTFNVTRERIRQIENQSLKKLQSLAEAQKLRDVA